MPSPTPRRTLLFVPGADPRKLERARQSGADTVLLDLEDSVPAIDKAAARARVVAALREGSAGAAEVAVRVNAPGTPDLEADLEGVIGAGGSLIMLPKAEDAEEIVRIAERIDELEGRREGGPRARLLLLVESPAGVADALRLCRATPRIDGLGFGHADFSLLMGLTEADASSGIAYHARCALAIAARAAGAAPIDSVYLSVKDETGFREDCLLGQRLGFEGKLCIHPRQVEIANQVYTPAPEQIEYARRVVEAWEQARAGGLGVVALDGKMIDPPVVALQERVIERARRAGALVAPSR